MKDLTTKSWFCVLNNPEEHGYTGTPQEIVDKLCEEWISASPTRTGAWIYCISADGLKHVHMVLEDVKTMRFSAVKKSYAVGMHFEPTKGTKEQAEDYINKRGKFEEKGEKIIASARYGEIKGAQGQRRDSDVLGELIDSGKTPREILAMSFAFRKYEKQIISAYRDKKINEIPFVRDVFVNWHVGASGSGKSYTANQLIKKHGEDNVYFMTDYETGCFDSYMCQPVLFMDEYRGQFPYTTLLTLLDKYRKEVHARYSNVSTAWTEVHITSVMTPDEIYRLCVSEDIRETETFAELRRRIDVITFHWKDGGNFYQFSLPMTQYKDRTDLQVRALMSVRDSFVPAPDIVIPFCK